MYGLVWMHEQKALGVGNYLYVSYDESIDRTIIQSGDWKFGRNLSFMSFDDDSLRAKLLISGHLILNYGEMSDFTGVEVFRCGNVVTYIAVNAISSYIIVGFDKVFDDVIVFNYDCFSPDFVIRYTDKCFIILNCDIRVLYLMTKSENFKKAILERLTFVGSYKCERYILSSLKGVQYICMN